MEENRYGLEYKPAETKEEYDYLVKTKPVGMITNKEEFKEYSDRFLSKINPNTLDHFKESLIFCNGGLGGADYSKLGDEITIKEFKKLFAHFGISMKYFGCRDDKICGTGTTGTNGNSEFTLSCYLEVDAYCDENYCPECL